MSCHDIGRGLNSVVEETLLLYGSNEITKSAAKKIIHTCQRAVNYCDGNEYEAVEVMSEGHICGNCLKEKDETFNLWRYTRDYSAVSDLLEEKGVATEFSLCSDCIEKLAKQIYDFDWKTYREDLAE